ncbi:hypothetical protein Tco_0891748 [Tanacetum coccineum]|uniref:Retrovirus-related Pol polyprotein from transposon TNT 1-94 n=1 Tax=Tanacetum coccineum TaxID=301880 RepID=A0ABQ5C753_9ASTR
MAMIEDCWFQAMQDEIHEFDRLENMINLPDGFKNAFLNGDLQGRSLVSQPEGFEDQDNSYFHGFYRLEKALYWAKAGTKGVDNAMSLTAYADADHAGCQDSRRSTSGSAQFLGDRLVSWSSKKQRSTAISTSEAEYIAMSGCTTDTTINTSTTPPPTTKTTGLSRYSGRKLKFRNLECIISGRLRDIGYQLIKRSECLRSISSVIYKDGKVRSKCENKGIVPTEMELVLEYTQQGASHEVSNTMAEQNVPNQPPTRTDEQIVPRSQWLIIGKSNLLFNAQKIQKNPIFQISVDN